MITAEKFGKWSIGLSIGVLAVVICGSVAFNNAKALWNGFDTIEQMEQAERDGADNADQWAAIKKERAEACAKNVKCLWAREEIEATAYCSVAVEDKTPGAIWLGDYRGRFDDVQYIASAGMFALSGRARVGRADELVKYLCRYTVSDKSVKVSIWGAS